jgi:hypothetical protein
MQLHIMGTERRAHFRPPSSIFGQYEPWTEPQLNLRWIWVCCAEILWNSSLRGDFFSVPTCAYALRNTRDSLIWSEASKYYCQDAIGQKKTISHSLAITIDTVYTQWRRREELRRVRAICVIYLNITGATDLTSAPPQVKSSLLHIISLRIGTRGLGP